ncbi:alpha-E domain-containing protein, partial [Pelobacter seleniigenes]|uniref:alpha-E domain-containing protein n=1 Tax=Pelobacter seleniigenes TaxID=407188 RepID=UPI0004A714E9
MLSRIARNTFELGQQIERIENIARLLEVNEKMTVQGDLSAELDPWTPLLAVTRSLDAYHQEYAEVNRARVINYLLWDDRHPYSVSFCLSRARLLARTIRERISEEMWLLLNSMYHDLHKLRHIREQHEFNWKIQQFCNAFHGLAANTMVHGHTWQFLQLGTVLERALMTCRILEMKYHILLPTAADVGTPIDLHQWQGLLRSVSGYEAYRRLYLARIDPANVVNLLLINARFPRSVHYCIQQAHQGLKGIGMYNEEQFRLFMGVEEFLEDLREGIDGREILAAGLMEFLQAMQERIEGLIGATHRAYFNSITVTIIDEQQRRLAIQIPQQ